MHTPEAQAIIDRREQERMDRIEGRRPMFDTALTRGDYLLAEPGAELWARTEGDLADVRMNPDGDARGGIILEVTSSSNPETGEVLRSFRCFDYTAPLWQATTVLTEAMVDPDSFTAPNWARLRGVYRRLGREFGAKRGPASMSEINMVVDAARLASIVGQRLP